MTAQDWTASLTHTPRYSVHQDIYGFEVELREDGEPVRIEDIDRLYYTVFDVLRLRPYLDAFCKDDKHSVRISAASEDAEHVLLSAVEGRNGIQGDYPTFRVLYFREDHEGEAITPLNMPKSYPNFDALLDGFPVLLDWMDGNSMRSLALYFTPHGGKETLLCEIVPDNGNLRDNAFKLYASGLTR